jgi:starvation-inducible DNA-binding protein
MGELNQTPGVDEDSAAVMDILQGRLSAYNDLHLTLKHVHWNVVGPSFIGVHEMLDPQVTLVRDFADDVAERIATMGGTPLGTVQAIIERRDCGDYALGRDTTQAHLAEVDAIYRRVIEANRRAIDAVGVDPITQDLLIGQTAALEKFRWFVRAHLQPVNASARQADGPLSSVRVAG